MIDEQKLRELGSKHMTHTLSLSVAEVIEGGATILALLDELATLRSERTAWRVTAENAEKDAARYRWLRDSKVEDDAQEWLCAGVFDMGGVAEIDGTELDAAIDNAMKETP